MKPGIALGLSLLGLLALLLIYWQPSRDRQPPADAPVVEGEPDDPLEGDEPPEPEARAPQPSPGSTSPSQAEAAAHDELVRKGEPAAPGDSEQEPENLPAPPLERTGQVELLKAVYENDPADTGAGEVEAQIRALSGTEHIPADAIRGVRCTKRVCQVVMHWSEGEPLSYMAVGMRLHQHYGGQVAVEPLGQTEDGEHRLELYVVREGYSLDDLR